MPLEEKTKRKKIIKGFLHRILPQLIFFLLNAGLIGVILFLTYQEFLYYGYIMQLITFFFLLSLVYQYFQYRKSIRVAEREEEALIIEDTGVGIKEEDLPKIFEKSYTGWNGRLQEKSTGIGLFISRKIVDRLNHSLRIESEVGIGTRAIIDFSREDRTLFD